MILNTSVNENDFVIISILSYTSKILYRVSQKVGDKLNMLVYHIMMNKIYIGTCVRKFKLRPLEGDKCTKTGEWGKQSFQAWTLKEKDE